MSLRARLKRRAQRAGGNATTGPAVVFNLPDNGCGGPGPGRYAWPGSRGVLVLYEAGTEPPSRAVGRADQAETDEVPGDGLLVRHAAGALRERP